MQLADVELTRDGTVVLARLSGEVDLSNAGSLRRALASAIPNDALGMVLDLTPVDYLDSAGIHMLYRLDESVRARGQRLRLVIPPVSAVADVLRLAGINAYVDAVETVKEALDAMRDR